MINSEVDALKAKFQNTLKKFDEQSKELDDIFKALPNQAEEVGFYQEKIAKKSKGSSRSVGN